MQNTCKDACGAAVVPPGSLEDVLLSKNILVQYSPRSVEHRAAPLPQHQERYARLSVPSSITSPATSLPKYNLV